MDMVLASISANTKAPKAFKNCSLGEQRAFCFWDVWMEPAFYSLRSEQGVSKPGHNNFGKRKTKLTFTVEVNLIWRFLSKSFYSQC